MQAVRGHGGQEQVGLARQRPASRLPQGSSQHGDGFGIGSGAELAHVRSMREE